MSAACVGPHDRQQLCEMGSGEGRGGGGGDAGTNPKTRFFFTFLNLLRMLTEWEAMAR